MLRGTWLPGLGELAVVAAVNTKRPASAYGDCYRGTGPQHPVGYLVKPHPYRHRLDLVFWFGLCPSREWAFLSVEAFPVEGGDRHGGTWVRLRPPTPDEEAAWVLST